MPHTDHSFSSIFSGRLWVVAGIWALSYQLTSLKRRLLSDQQETAEKLLSPSIMEAIPDAVAAVNQQGVIVQVNSQTESMFGYTRRN